MATKKDHLDFKSNAQLINNEEIYYSTLITKFNDGGERQERNLVLTDQAIYNFKAKTLKRRIQWDKLESMTRSTNSSEFVIHIKDDNDFRFSSFNRRNEIIETIIYILCKVKKLCQAFKMYEVDFINLNVVMTTHKMQKLGQKKRPDESKAKIIDLESFATEEKKESERKTNTRKSTSMIFNVKKSDQIVCLDDFDLLKMLGKGAFGEVVLAQHKETNKMYAVKILKKKDIVEMDQLEHTKTEQKILAHVNHPFLVNLDYAFQTESRLYFVMEFMKGGELFTHLRKQKKLSEKQAKFYAACITLGLGHLHNSNFIYRDLKLENLLLDELGYAKLTDFGLAKFLTSDKKALTFCGTPEYLSPEVILGKGHNRATDWWSLGILIYEMIFGIPPFYSQKQDDMFRKIVKEDFVFKTTVTVTDSCKQIIIKLLDKNQTTRLGSTMDSMEILSHEWFGDIDISLLLSKKLPAPFIPEVKDKKWEQNFDDEFINEEIRMSQLNPEKVNVDALANLQKEFEGMDFVKEQSK